MVSVCSALPAAKPYLNLTGEMLYIASGICAASHEIACYVICVIQDICLLPDYSLASGWLNQHISKLWLSRLR